MPRHIAVISRVAKINMFEFCTLVLWHIFGDLKYEPFANVELSLAVSRKSAN